MFQALPHLLLLAESSAAPTGYGGALLRMVLALLVVCVGAYVVLRFGVRRLMAPSMRGHKEIRVVERCPLEPGKSLWVVEVDSRRLLLGASDRGLNLVAELQSGKVAKSFSQVLADADETPPPADEEGESVG